MERVAHIVNKIKRWFFSVQRNGLFKSVMVNGKFKPVLVARRTPFLQLERKHFRIAVSTGRRDFCAAGEGVPSPDDQFACLTLTHTIAIKDIQPY